MEEKPKENKPIWRKSDLGVKQLQLSELDAKIRDLDFKMLHQQLTIDYMKKHPEDSIKSAEFNLNSMKHQKHSMELQKKVVEKHIVKIKRNGV